MRCRQKSAPGVALGGLRAHGAQAHEDAIERAEELRPIFDELAGLSARKIAAVLNERKVTALAVVIGMRQRSFVCRSDLG